MANGDTLQLPVFDSIADEQKWFGLAHAIKPGVTPLPCAQGQLWGACVSIGAKDEGGDVAKILATTGGSQVR